MLAGGLLRQNVETFISAERSSLTSDYRPDVGIRILSPGATSRQWRDRNLVLVEPFDFTATPLWLEFKHGRDADPFSDRIRHPEKPFERAGEDARKVRGQLAKYADAQFSQQHLRYSWGVLICESIARITRWDRSGMLVTEAFDYVKTSFLAEFLWKFFHMTPEERGWDESVVTVDDTGQKNLFYDTIGGVIASDRGKIRGGSPYAYLSMDSDYPVRKIEVKDAQTSKVHSFLIGRPFYVTRGPLGRATRSYVAYGLGGEGVKYLKDSWAVDNSGLLPEGDAYTILNKAGVPSLLPITCAGNVEVAGIPQKTETQVWAAKPYPWRAPCSSSFRTFRHYRLVQDLAYPIECLRSSREVVMVFCDVLKCMSLSWTRMIYVDLSTAQASKLRMKMPGCSIEISV